MSDIKAAVETMHGRQQFDLIELRAEVQGLRAQLDECHGHLRQEGWALGKAEQENQRLRAEIDRLRLNHADVVHRKREAQKIIAGLRSEMKEWRAKLATQCGHTLAMQALLNRELESNSERDCTPF